MKTKIEKRKHGYYVTYKDKEFDMTFVSNDEDEAKLRKGWLDSIVEHYESKLRNDYVRREE